MTTFLPAKCALQRYSSFRTFPPFLPTFPVSVLTLVDPIEGALQILRFYIRSMKGKSQLLLTQDSLLWHRFRASPWHLAFTGLYSDKYKRWLHSWKGWEGAVRPVGSSPPLAVRLLAACFPVVHWLVNTIVNEDRTDLVGPKPHLYKQLDSKFLLLFPDF